MCQIFTKEHAGLIERIVICSDLDFWWILFTIMIGTRNAISVQRPSHTHCARNFTVTKDLKILLNNSFIIYLWSFLVNIKTLQEDKNDS